MRIAVIRVLVFLALAFVSLPSSLAAQVSVLTHHGDNARTGANLSETILNISNVNSKSFGKLATRPVDGNVYAQPLVAAGARAVNRKDPANLVIVATERNQVYAFDADDIGPDSKRAMVWNTGPDVIGPSVPSNTLADDIAQGICVDLIPDIGITGTPVIQITKEESPREGVVYFVAKTKARGAYHNHLFALRLSDGALLSKLEIKGEVKGTGLGSVNGIVRFDPMLHMNRPGLLLVGNRLYVAFGPHCDLGEYHGWMFSFDVSNPKSMKRLAIYNTTPNGPGPDAPKPLIIEGGAGIWMSGEGPAADESGAVYFTTGNGTNNRTTDFGDSVVKVMPKGKELEVVDWFAPDNEKMLQDYDIDLGTSGAVLLPDSHLVITGSKQGRFYLMDRNNLGKAGPALEVLQVTHGMIPPIGTYGIYGTPAVWHREQEILIYMAGAEDPVTRLRLMRDKDGEEWKREPKFQRGSISSPFPHGVEFGTNRRSSVWMPGGFLTLSANSADPKTGILWITMPFTGSANHVTVRGVLRAMDASDITKPELWNSEETEDTNDRVGMFAKFVPPTVANGKVYVATFQRELTADDEVVTAGTGEVITPEAPAALVIYGLR